MHIVHIYKDYDPPVVGGIERMIRWTAERTARRPDCKVSVLVACPADKSLRDQSPTRESINDVDIIRLPSLMRPGGTPIALGFPREFADLKPDIAHIHHPCPSADLTAWSHFGASRPPFVVTWHSDVVRQKLAYYLYRPLQRWMLKNAARIMPTSGNYLESSLQLRGFESKSEIIPLGIDHEEIAARTSPRVDKILTNTRGLPIVLFVGVLRYYKGLHVLLEAWKQVDSEAALIVVGDGPLRKELQEIVDSEHSDSSTITLTGFLDDDEVWALRQASAIAVLPSQLRAEAFGLSQVEAMAAGLPVISCDLPTGVPEVNRHKQTGLVIPPGESAPLAAAIDQLLGDSELRQSLSDTAREVAATDYAADSMEDKIFQVYSTVMEQT